LSDLVSLIAFWVRGKIDFTLNITTIHLSLCSALD
jgi:hypothetical protein